MKFKRFINILFIFTLLFLIATPALAGWKDALQDNIINGGIVVLFAIIAGLFGKKWLKFKAPVQALLVVFAEYRNGKLLQSEEGKDLSKAEWNKIFEKMTLVVDAFMAIMPASWLPANNNPK